MTTDHSDELAQELKRLRDENTRLAALLDMHGVAWRLTKPAATPAVAAAAAPLTTDDKVALFRRLFLGRTDVYPVRWESKAGKVGYSPACANEWRAGVCEKPRIKCADCHHRRLVPLTDQTVYDHLAGRHTVGVYLASTTSFRCKTLNEWPTASHAVPCDELLRGELGPVCLGWLAAAARDGYRDDALEPDLPTALSALAVSFRPSLRFRRALSTSVTHRRTASHPRTAPPRSASRTSSPTRALPSGPPC